MKNVNKTHTNSARPRTIDEFLPGVVGQPHALADGLGHDLCALTLITLSLCVQSKLEIAQQQIVHSSYEASVSARNRRSIKRSENSGVFTMLTKINIYKCSINICRAKIAAHSFMARLSKFILWELF